MLLLYLIETEEMNLRRYIVLPQSLVSISVVLVGFTRQHVGAFWWKASWDVYGILVPCVKKVAAAVGDQSEFVVKAMESPMAEGPHLAWFAYIFSVSSVKMQDRVKVKHLGISVMMLPLCYFVPMAATTWSFSIRWDAFLC